MMSRFGKWFLICALIVSIGGHWAVLQVVAWTGMTISYSQNDAFSAALSKTFDGKHPCKLCKLVNEGKKSESKSEAQLDLKKLDFVALTPVEFYFAPLKQNPSSPIACLLSRAQTPPTPPPVSA